VHCVNVKSSEQLHVMSRTCNYRRLTGRSLGSYTERIVHKHTDYYGIKKGM
jgi:hypothetical protein